jgi:hypothetical protein
MNSIVICEENKIVSAFAKKLKVKTVCMVIDVYLKDTENYTRFVADWDKINFESNRLPKNIVMQ